MLFNKIFILNLFVYLKLKTNRRFAILPLCEWRAYPAELQVHKANASFFSVHVIKIEAYQKSAIIIICGFRDIGFICYCSIASVTR